MIYKSNNETIWLHSMGKRFQLVAVATSNDAANEFCEKHDRCGVIACFDGLVFIANLYAGEVSV